MRTKTVRRAIGKPSVMILHEKYSTRVFEAGNDAALFKSCLKILKERMAPDYGYIYDPVEEQKSCEESGLYGAPKPEITRAEAAQLKDRSIREMALEKWNEYDREQAQFRASCDQYNRAKEAIANQDGAMAYKILCERSDYEYEGFDLVELE